MAETQDYIDPIIKAMIATRQAQQESQNLAEKTRSSKAEEAWRQHQLDIAEKENERTHNLNVERLNVERDRAEAELKSQAIMRSLAVGKGLREGDIKAPTQQQQIPNVPGVIGGGQNVQVPQPFTLPGTDFKIDPRLYTNPDEAGARLVAQKAAEAESSRLAQEHYAEFVNKLPPNEKDKLQAETARSNAQEATARATTVAGMNIAGRAEGKQSDFDRAMGVALLRMNAANNGSSVDEGTAQQYLDGLFVNGKMKLSQIPQKQRQAVLDAGKKIGYTTVLDPKDNEQIDGIPLMQDFIAKAKRLAEIGSGFSGKTGVITGGLVGNEAAGNLKQQVDGMLGNIARIYGGEKGVLTQKDIERGVGLVYSARLSKEENLKKVEALEKVFKEKLSPVLNNYPENQRQAILEQRGINIDLKQTKQPSKDSKFAIGPNNHKVFTDDKGATWYDVQTGQQMVQ